MSQNGWKKWTKQAGGSRYEAYESRMVIIVSDTQARYVYMMPPVYAALGKPDRIDVYTRGSNIGFFKSDNGGGYKVVRKRAHHDPKNPYISLTALMKTWSIEPGAYDAHIEDGGVVFDTQQKPSKI